MKSLYYALRTIGYFVLGGVVFGGMFGMVAGAAMFPVIGLMGTAFGLPLGLACGLLSGLIMAVVQALTFHPEIDLPVYRWRAALGMGTLVGVSAPLMLLTVMPSLMQSSPLNTAFAPFLAAFWGSLSAAFVTHHYVNWRASLRGEDSAKLLLLPHKHITLASEALGNSLLISCLFMMLGLATLALLVYGFINDWGLFDSLPDSLLNLFIGGALTLLGWLIAASCIIHTIVFSQAGLITFLKHLIFNESRFSPRIIRGVLTFASFILTIGTCWWMNVFSPFIALIVT
jgi:hypothetical protein